MKLDQFKQLNLVGVIERANDILEAIKSLGTSPDAEEKIIQAMKDHRDPGDQWEHAAMELAAVELMEQRIRIEDPNCESAPKGWDGGIRQAIDEERR